jgi:8-oxo-dGTP diphosphatase
MSIGHFYAMVGVLLWCPVDGKYLVLKRSGNKDFASDAWECVTGRVDQGESFTAAARREVYEELGVEVEMDFVVGTAHFYRGEVGPENEIIGVQYCCSIQDSSAIQASWEHSEMRWITAKEAAGLLPHGHWLREAIRRAEAIRALASQELVDYYRREGFEL